jgi:hypothetical protein
MYNPTIDNVRAIVLYATVIKCETSETRFTSRHIL